MGILPSLSPPRILGQGVKSYLFGKETMRQNTCWERNFDFQPTARESWAKRQGWPGVRQIFLEFQHFSLKGPSLKSGLLKLLLFLLATFSFDAPRGPRGENEKSKLQYYF